MESRTRTSQVADPRTSLAMWLRAGRAERQLTLDDVARVTKIQPRILEKIEAGQLEGLPAEVFVRGFVKSFARCVGLDESEAVARYGQCANAPATPTSSIARAFVETLVAAPKSEPKASPVAPSVLVEPEIFPSASLAMPAMAAMSDSLDIDVTVDDVAVAAAPAMTPMRGIEVVEIPAIEVVEVAESRELGAADEIPAGGKKKRTRKKPAGTSPPRSRKKKSPTGDAFALEASSTVAEAASAEAASAELATAEPTAADETAAPLDPGETLLADGSEPVVTDPWKPTMPPMATMPSMASVAASVPWKRPAYPITRTTKSHAFALPTLVIDDSDPDLADLERDGRDRAAKPGPHRVSFLPPILLDRDDKSSRQGGLTLAVILLLIAATLTLSYLMRRPSVSGDGMTQIQSIVDTTTIVA
jgi:hypothetical protein